MDEESTSMPREAGCSNRRLHGLVLRLVLRPGWKHQNVKAYKKKGEVCSVVVLMEDVSLGRVFSQMVIGQLRCRWH